MNQRWTHSIAFHWTLLNPTLNKIKMTAIWFHHYLGKKGGYSNFQGQRKNLITSGIPWEIKQWHVTSFFIILIIYYCSINVFDGVGFMSSWNKNQFAQLYKCYQIPKALYHVPNVSYSVLVFQVLNKTLQNFKTIFPSTMYFFTLEKFS